jgi:hypothetical protein
MGTLNLDGYFTTVESTPRPAERAQAMELSRQLYSDPKAFVEALRTNFSRFDKDKTNDVSQDELRHYATVGDDPTVRVLAQTALNVYGDIKGMSGKLPKHAVASNKDGITLTDLQIADDSRTGNTAQYISDARSGLRNEAFMDGGLALAWGGITAGYLYMKRWNMAALTGSLALLRAYSVYDDLSQRSTAQATITTRFDENRRLMEDWRLRAGDRRSTD